MQNNSYIIAHLDLYTYVVALKKIYISDNSNSMFTQNVNDSVFTDECPAHLNLVIFALTGQR